MEHSLDILVNRYRDKTLNDLPEFADLNPSLENFARIMWHGFADGFDADNLTRIRLVIRESEYARASFDQNL